MGQILILQQLLDLFYLEDKSDGRIFPMRVSYLRSRASSNFTYPFLGPLLDRTSS